MGIRRSELSFDDKYTQVPNEWVRDVRLSRRARGLLVEIMSHRVGWHVSIRSLSKVGKEGRDAIQSALNELLEHGYIRRMQGRAFTGKFAEIEYELCEPRTVAGKSVHGAVSGFPVSGSTVSGESAHKEEHHEEDHPEELLSAVADGVSLLDQIWDVWPAPRRSTRKVVEQKLRAALKVASWDVIFAAAEKHCAVWAGWPESDRRQYVPLLSTWLHQERWSGAVPLPRESRLSALDRGRAADALLSEPHLRALS